MRSYATEVSSAPRNVAASPFRATANGVRVAVKLTPKAALDRIQGIAEEADGTVALKVWVTAAAEGGKANAALIKLLAKTWKLPKSAIVLVSGATQRRKILHVAGAPASLLARLETWLREPYG